MTAAAAAVIPEAVPPVTAPPPPDGGGRFARASSPTPGRAGRDERLEPAATERVDRERRRRRRQAAVDRGDAAQVHVAGLGVDHVAEDGVTYVGWLYARPGDGFANHGGGEIARRDPGKTSPVSADSGPHRGQDENVGLVAHGFSLLTCRGRR